MLHALDLALELRAHEPARLRARDAQGVLDRRRIQAEELGDRGRRRGRAEDRPGVPAHGEHVRAVERVADAGPNLQAREVREEEGGAGSLGLRWGPGERGGRGEEGGENDGV